MTNLIRSEVIFNDWREKQLTRNYFWSRRVHGRGTDDGCPCVSGRMSLDRLLGLHKRRRARRDRAESRKPRPPESPHVPLRQRQRLLEGAVHVAWGGRGAGRSCHQYCPRPHRCRRRSGLWRREWRIVKKLERPHHRTRRRGKCGCATLRRASWGGKDRLHLKPMEGINISLVHS